MTYQSLVVFLLQMKHEENENLMGFKVVITTRSIIHLPIESLLNNPQVSILVKFVTVFYVGDLHSLPAFNWTRL
jgi:hypothetical protein